MTDQPLIERQLQNVSERFRKMAERIDHNADAQFGGAAVIYPPSGAGDPIEVLLIDSKGDPAQFYSTIQTRIQVLLTDLQERQRVASGFGVR